MHKAIGLGLRLEHMDDIIEYQPKVPWFEILLDDFLHPGPHHQKLDEIVESYPIVFHSVGLNLGGVDQFDQKHLKKVRDLYEKYKPQWVSDHLCWSSYNGKFHHDLLPIPKTTEGLSNVVDRINYLQDFFQRQMVVENITSYIDFKNEEFQEIEFINRLVEKTNCGLLLDITNVIINHRNRNLDYKHYFHQFPLKHVKQVHLSGYAESDGVLIDSHSSRVNEEDISVLKSLYDQGFGFPAMIERDSELPDFFELEHERQSIEEAVYELR
jgi:uncharacterized protein (UPF0276 family)